MKLAYLILAHKNANQVKRLVRSIYDRRNYYLIHMDKKSHGDCHAGVSELISMYPNVYAMKSMNCTWGGFSIVEVQLRGIRQLLRLADDWSFLINLSGQDFPLRPQEEIISFLADKKDSNFMSWFDPLVAPWWPNPLSRIHRFYLEIPCTKKIFFFPKWLKIDRRFLIGNATWYGGPQWVIANRESCDYIADPRHVRKYKVFFKSTFIPDESFFQTVLLNSVYRDTVIADYKRQVNWHKGPDYPRTYTIEDSEELMTSSAFFARKFDEAVDSAVLELLERRVLCNAMA